MTILVEASPEWHLQALCADDAYNADLWFEDADSARRICAHCPVRDECLTYALNSEIQSGNQLIGVWGGLSPIQRKRLRDHPERLERMRRVRSRTHAAHLRLLPSPRKIELSPRTVTVQLVLEV